MPPLFFLLQGGDYLCHIKALQWQIQVSVKKVKWQKKTHSNGIQKTWNTPIQLYCLSLVESSNFHIPHWHTNCEQKATKEAFVTCQRVFPSGVMWRIKGRPSCFSNYMISVSYHLGDKQYLGHK